MNQQQAAKRTQQIKHWNGRVLFECEIPDEVESGMAMRHALEWLKNRAYVADLGLTEGAAP